jgi:hypothetical protein
MRKLSMGASELPRAQRSDAQYTKIPSTFGEVDSWKSSEKDVSKYVIWYPLKVSVWCISLNYIVDLQVAYLE